jgi:hypothetical protein
MAHFRPLHDRILVKRIEAEEKTRGGIIIPDTAKGERTPLSVGGTPGREPPISPRYDSRAVKSALMAARFP